MIQHIQAHVKPSARCGRFPCFVHLPKPTTQNAHVPGLIWLITMQFFFFFPSPPLPPPCLGFSGSFALLRCTASASTDIALTSAELSEKQTATTTMCTLFTTNNPSPPTPPYKIHHHSVCMEDMCLCLSHVAHTARSSSTLQATDDFMISVCLWVEALPAYSPDPDGRLQILLLH